MPFDLLHQNIGSILVPSFRSKNLSDKTTKKLKFTFLGYILPNKKNFQRVSSQILPVSGAIRPVLSEYGLFSRAEFLLKNFDREEDKKKLKFTFLWYILAIKKKITARHNLDLTSSTCSLTCSFRIWSLFLCRDLVEKNLSGKTTKKLKLTFSGYILVNKKCAQRGPPQILPVTDAV